VKPGIVWEDNEMISRRGGTRQADSAEVTWRVARQQTTRRSRSCADSERM